MQFSNLNWYKSEIVSVTGYYDSRFELRKEAIYEQGYRSRCIVVYMILSKRDEIDSILQTKEIANMEDIKFISFKNTTTKDKVSALHINEINNVPVRFESLLEVNAKEEAIYEGE